MNVIVDTNILFTALLKENSSMADILINPESEDTFFLPRYAFVELFKHKEKIIQFTKLSEENLLETLHLLLKQVQFIDEDMIALQSFIDAHKLVHEIDEKDLFFVAMTIELNAYLWTGDKRLIRGLQAKGFHKFYIP